MKKSISVTYLLVVALLLTSAVLKAEEGYEAIGYEYIDYETSLSIEGEYVKDSELNEHIGKGTDTHAPELPDTLSVILWDEIGSGKKSTLHQSMSGSGNIQKVNVRLNGN